MANPNIAEFGKDTQIKPGQVLNPNGRGKGVRTIKSVLEELFNSDVDIEDIQGVPKKMKGIDACVLAQFKKAIKEGDAKAFELLSDRWEGKVPNKSQISGDPENPYGIQIVVNKPSA